MPTRYDFISVYYDRTNDYWDIADTWGVQRWQVDDWRRAFHLPSRRTYGTRRAPDDSEWEDPIPRWDHYTGRVLQRSLWDRRRLPPATLAVLFPPRRINNTELSWCVR